ncbi:hypothetical protein [Dokdonella sp.]|uniref:hypothetical protein n=1 Tax=Dokdonella sp. TaxID=2291710 RepID=UPI003C60FC9C
MSEKTISLSRLVEIVIGLCRFRGGPQDLPHSSGLLVGMLVAAVLLDYASGSLLGFDDTLLARSLLSISLLLALCWTALSIRGLGNRYLQTMTALVSCSMAFSLLILPLAWLFGNPQGAEVILTPAQIMVAWLGLGVLIWKIAVDAHIVRQAIDAPFWLGLMLAISWAIADYALSRLIFFNDAAM